VTWSLIRVPFGSRAAVRTISGSSSSVHGTRSGSQVGPKSTVLRLIHDGVEVRLADVA
jgi:hypothetical protein